MSILGPTRAASNYSNAQNLKVFGSKLNNADVYNDPKVAALLNRNAMAICEQNILQLYCSRFKWESSDNTMPTDYIEYMLFYNGILAFFWEEQFGWLLLPCSVLTVNVYGQPEEVSVALPIGTKATVKLTKDQFVLVRDNSALNIPFVTVEHYSRMVSDTERTCDVYARAMKKPIIVSANFKNKKSREIFAQNIHNNETTVIIDESMIEAVNEMKVLQNTSHSSEDLKGLLMYKQNLYNECISKLGVVTPTIMKAAQVNEDEINKNDTMANIILENAFACREEANRRIYEMSGISLTCRLADNLVKDDDPDDETIIPKKEE